MFCEYILFCFSVLLGDWIIECRTNSHLTGGMRALYRVADCSNSRQKRQTFEFSNEIESRVEYYDEGPLKHLNTLQENKSPKVLPKKLLPARDGRVREYFVAAVEEEWEYAPKDRHLIMGGSLMDTE